MFIAPDLVFWSDSIEIRLSLVLILLSASPEIPIIRLSSWTIILDNTPFPSFLWTAFLLPHIPSVVYFIASPVSQTLEAGTNYFWVEYVLATPTVLGNLLDGTCTNMTIGGNLEVPTTTNPLGNRSIGICNPSPGGIDNNLTLWLDAKNGAESGGTNATDADLVDKWLNKATNPGLTDLDQTNND